MGKDISNAKHKLLKISPKRKWDFCNLTCSLGMQHPLSFILPPHLIFSSPFSSPLFLLKLHAFYVKFDVSLRLCLCFFGKCIFVLLSNLFFNTLFFSLLFNFIGFCDWIVCDGHHDRHFAISNVHLPTFEYKFNWNEINKCEIIENCTETNDLKRIFQKTKRLLLDN